MNWSWRILISLAGAYALFLFWRQIEYGGEQ